MSEPAGSREAAGFCAELVRSHDFTRYASALFVPASQRRALLALYAFNVEVSRVHEHVSQPLPGEIDQYSLARIFAAANAIDTLIVGTGTDVWIPPKSLREALRAVRVVLDAMQTGPAIRTYNIMLGERRRVAAALIAVP